MRTDVGAPPLSGSDLRPLVVAWPSSRMSSKPPAGSALFRGLWLPAPQKSPPTILIFAHIHWLCQPCTKKNYSSVCPHAGYMAPYVYALPLSHGLKVTRYKARVKRILCGLHAEVTVLPSPALSRVGISVTCKNLSRGVPVRNTLDFACSITDTIRHMERNDSCKCLDIGEYR